MRPLHVLLLCPSAVWPLEIRQRCRRKAGFRAASTRLPSKRRLNCVQTVLLDGNRALVLRAKDQWLAIVGIPLSTSPGPAEVLLQAGVEPARPVRFEISSKEYASQHLKVAPGQVNLSKRNLARVERERLRIQGVLATYSKTQPPTLLLQAPIPGPRSSSFGLRRFFNNESRNPHSGMDIAAPVGTPVKRRPPAA